MNYPHDLASTLRQSGIDPGNDQGFTSCRGWDFWEPKRPIGNNATQFDPLKAVQSATIKPDTDGTGVARTPHWHLLGNADLPKGTLPVISADMNVQNLIAGIWRQILIRPSSDQDPIGENPYLVRDFEKICVSSRHVMALVGHPPRDLAIWLDHLRNENAELFRVVLAKDMKAAIAHDPRVIEQPWPEEVRSLWKDNEADYLPPFLAATLYDEIAHTAMNQAGLVALAFDGKTHLTTKHHLERIGTNIGLGETYAATQAIKYAPYQTVMLSQGEEIIESNDINALEARFQALSSKLALVASTTGDLDIAPQTLEQAQFLMRGMSLHPQFLPEPHGNHGHWLKSRATSMYWGINWRLNSAVRLLEIAQTAREWNILYRPGGPTLPDMENHRTANPVALALRAIGFRWTAEASPAAALSLLVDMAQSKDEKAELRESDESKVEPLTVDAHIGDKSGLDLQKQALDELERLPKPGEFGYTARSQAHLWLDNVGDDIARYQNLQAEEVRRHEEVSRGSLPRELFYGPENPAEILFRPQWDKTGDGAIGHARKTPLAMSHDPVAARGAQLEGQRISPLSVDPIFAWGSREK